MARSISYDIATYYAETLPALPCDHTSSADRGQRPRALVSKVNVIDEKLDVITSPACVQRLSPESSRKFATLFKRLLYECGFSSYSLYLEVDYPRSTLMRWLAGKTRIPSDAALTLVKGLVARIERASSSSALGELNVLLQAQFADPGVSMLQTELRARRIPIQPTLDALRAAKLLPPSNAPNQQANDVHPTHQEPRSSQCQS